MYTDRRADLQRMRRECELEAERLGDAVKSSSMLATTRSWNRQRMNFSLRVLKGARPIQHLGFGLPVSRTVREKFLLFQAKQFEVMCYSSLKKLMHMESET